MVKRKKNIQSGMGFILFMAWALCCLGVWEMLLTLLAILIHESGHIIAVILSGGRISHAEADTGGLELRYSGGSMSYAADALLSAAGPAASLFAAILCSTLGKYLEFTGMDFFTGLNLLFFLFNLLPVSVLDGGKIFFAVIASLFGPFAAEKFRIFLDAAIIAALFAGGAAVMFRYPHNPTLLICAVVIADSCCKYNDCGVKLHRK